MTRPAVQQRGKGSVGRRLGTGERLPGKILVFFALTCKVKRQHQHFLDFEAFLCLDQLDYRSFGRLLSVKKNNLWPQLLK